MHGDRSLTLAALVLALSCAAQSWPRTSTFSCVAYDPATGSLGVVVQSKFPAVGAAVPWARAGVGAIATQAAANLAYGEDGLRMLELGFSAEETLRKLTERHAGREERQMGIVDAQGRAATFTGKNTFPWAGGVTGKNYACQGNILAGPDVVPEMARVLDTAAGAFPERLMAALEAGQKAGGDRRGKESAALLVVRKGAGYGGVGDKWIDLRVDDHPEPIQELRRLLGVHHLYFGLTEKTHKLDAALTREVQSILLATGFYEGPINGVYDAPTRKALEDFQGWENLEMRFRKDGQIDDVVLRYMREHYGQNPRRLK
jgi:uncharacterized Ntn-hydrolase superfamily protein